MIRTKRFSICIYCLGEKIDSRCIQDCSASQIAREMNDCEDCNSGLDCRIHKMEMLRPDYLT